MTFKHSKFEDSPTMRSLEKIAVKHGLATPETRVKTASAEPQADYTPSGNLMENVLKLCAGLRATGFEKHANELESKFIEYKRANVYDTSKETGEDIVDSAHPDGSHDLKGVEGDATIETIVDQHLKDLNVVNKKPTGKLASNLDILNAVKLVLAQDASIIKKNLDALKSNVAAILRIYHSENVLGRPTSFAGGDLLDLVNSVDEKTLDINKAREIQTSVADVKKVYSPGFLALSGVSADAWKKMLPYFNSAEYEINEIVKELTNPAPQGKPLPSAPDFETSFVRSVYNVISKVNRTIDRIKNFGGKVKPGAKESDIRALQNVLARIGSVSQAFTRDIKNPALDKNQVLQNANESLKDAVVIRDQNGTVHTIDEYFDAWS